MKAFMKAFMQILGWGLLAGCLIYFLVIPLAAIFSGDSMELYAATKLVGIAVIMGLLGGLLLSIDA